MSRPIAVAATAAFGADVLERLTERHEITALVTRPDAPAGRGRKLVPSPAKRAAERLGIRVLEPERLVPGMDLGADVVVAVAYGLIVPDEVLAERLWLNVHPSLLPRWRGAAPVERALMAGDVSTGVSIIKLVKELDAGPIAIQGEFAVGLDEVDDLHGVVGAVSEEGARLLADRRVAVAHEEVQRFPQRPGGAADLQQVALDLVQARHVVLPGLAEHALLDLFEPLAQCLEQREVGVHHGVDEGHGMHGPQVEVLTVGPASMNVAISPSASACRSRSSNGPSAISARPISATPMAPRKRSG